ncbi:MAG: Flp family type IVb pilin [Acidimicrobiia bacterium]
MMLSQMITWLQARLNTNERGAAAVEYGMLVALIAAVVIAIVFTLGGQINDAFTKVSEGFKGNF